MRDRKRWHRACTLAAVLATLVAGCGDTGAVPTSTTPSGETASPTTTSTSSTPITAAPSSTATTPEPTTATTSQQLPPTTTAPVPTTTTTPPATQPDPPGAPPFLLDQIALAVGAGPGWDGCPASPTPAVLFQDAVHIGWGTYICMVGFDLEEPIRLRVTGPDETVLDEELGTEYVYDPVPDENVQDAFVYWLRQLPGSPLGRYEAVASQGAVTARGTYELQPVAWPMFFFVSGGTTAEFFDINAEPGDTIVLYVLGFPPDMPVEVHLYGGRQYTATDGSYLMTLPARTDGDGAARIVFPTDSSYSRYQMCPILDQASAVALGADPDYLIADEYFNWCYLYDLYFGWHEWIVVLESLSATDFTYSEARDRVDFGYACDDPCMYLVRSDDYGSLNPGYWVIFLAGGWPTQEQAAAHCDDLKQTGTDCYPRLLAP